MMSVSGRPLYGIGNLRGSLGLFEEPMTRVIATRPSEGERAVQDSKAVSAPGRIHAFDWLRGVAVVVMIQTHSVVLLEKALQSDRIGRWLMWIDGLVAPSFLFSAGFALALVQVRAAATNEGRLKQLKKSVTRIAEVLLVASLVNFIWFRELKWLLRIDILQCIGLSLAAVLPVLFALGRRPQMVRWVLLAIAGVVFFTSPFAEAPTNAWSLLVNTRAGILDASTGSPFPLFPWTGYVFLGASFGATVAVMRSEADLWRWLALLVGLGAALWASESFWRALYPPHNVWVTNPSNAGHRWTQVLLLLAMFRLIEVRWPRVSASRAVATLGAFGASSLSAYFFHEMLLYEHHVGFFSKLFRERLDWITYWPVLAALIVCTWLCMKLWAPLDARLRAWLKL